MTASKEQQQRRPPLTHGHQQQQHVCELLNDLLNNCRKVALRGPGEGADSPHQRALSRLVLGPAAPHIDTGGGGRGRHGDLDYHIRSLLVVVKICVDLYIILYYIIYIIYYIMNISFCSQQLGEE